MTIKLLTVPLGVCLALGGCTTPPPAHQATVAVVRPLGTFSGRGSQTVGVISESGRLRIVWRTHNESSPGTGTFKLALHSGVSGRPIAVIADSHGEDGGSREVEDDPRPYNLMIDSANVDWSFSVEEVVAAPAPR